MDKLETHGTRPLLTSFAVTRTEARDLPGRYCPDRHVWIVEGENGAMPIIATATESAYTPLTKVQRERDEFSALAHLELVTKTHQQMERDDNSPRGNVAVPELLTKTDVVQERDDTRSSDTLFLLELYTKTEETPERDD